VQVDVTDGGDARTRTRANSENRAVVHGRDSEGGRALYWRVEDPYHYIDIDRQTTAQPGDQSVPRGGYEGLDRAMLTARRQPAPPGEYAGLVTAAAAAAAAQPPVSGSTQPADQHSGSDGHIEMTDPAAGNDSPATVSQLIVLSLDRCRIQAVFCRLPKGGF